MVLLEFDESGKVWESGIRGILRSFELHSQRIRSFGCKKTYATLRLSGSRPGCWYLSGLWAIPILGERFFRALGFPNPTISRTFFSRAFSSSCWTSGVCEAQVWWLFFPLACRLLGAPSSYWSGFGASKLETRIRWRLLIVAWLFFFCLRLLCCSQAFFYYDVALLFDGWACRHRALNAHLLDMSFLFSLAF